MTFTILPGETACLACLFPDAASGAAGDAGIATCDTAGVLGWAVAWVAAQQVAECVKLLTGERAALRGSLLTTDLWTNELRALAAPKADPECRCCGRGDFVHLRGDHRPVLTLCGRNTVQIHEHRRALALPEHAERLRPHGAVRDTAFALRFRPRAPAGVDITVFPDGRALIVGTTDAALARSLYARYISA